MAHQVNSRTSPLLFLLKMLLEAHLFDPPVAVSARDSGGVQEEACILGVPCVTLRENTERPETIEVGANVLAGTDPEQILQKTEIMLRTRRGWKNPLTT